MRFNGICLISRDVKRLREFYESTLQVEAEGNDVHVKLRTAGAILSVFSESGMEGMAPGSMKDYGHGGFTIEFEVEDVDDEYQRLKSMDVPMVKMPTTQKWGRRSVWFRDPDGNIVNFYQDLSRWPQCPRLIIRPR